MTFKEEIDLQLKDNKVLSYEILSNLNDKTYFSGRDKQVGDTVLFGMLNGGSIDEKEVEIRLVTFHEEELGVLYEEDKMFYDKGNKTSMLPIIKRIENGN